MRLRSDARAAAVGGGPSDGRDGEEHITIHNLDGLWKTIGLHIVLRQKTLAPQEVGFLRQQMDLTQAELAKMLRVTDQTVARWEKGDTAVNGTADFALRAADQPTRRQKNPG